MERVIWKDKKTVNADTGRQKEKCRAKKEPKR